jgi:hypothetical protein
MTTMPANVKRYTGIIMEDDRRGIMFAPITMQPDGRLGDQRVRIIPLPGEHDTAVLWQKTEIGKIGAALAEEFLTHYRTQFRNTESNFLRTPLEYCELYAKARLKLNTYRNMFGPGWARRGPFEQARNVPNVERNDPYFINWHHARQFEMVFPNTFTYLRNAAGAGAAAGQNLQVVQTELLQSRVVYSSLVILNMIANAPPVVTSRGWT